MTKIIEIKSINPIDGKQYYKEISIYNFSMLPKIGETLIFHHNEKRYKSKICDIIHDITFPSYIETIILIDNIERYIFKQ